jgi:hypothetical protein
MRRSLEGMQPATWGKSIPCRSGSHVEPGARADPLERYFTLRLSFRCEHSAIWEATAAIVRDAEQHIAFGNDC